MAAFEGLGGIGSDNRGSRKFESGATGDGVFGFFLFWLRRHRFFLAEIPPWRKKKKFSWGPLKAFVGSPITSILDSAFHGKPEINPPP